MADTTNTTTATRYIPQDTRCVLRGPDGTARWYNTKKEVDLDAATRATCPMTGRLVLTVAQGEYGLFVAPESVCLRRTHIPAMSVLTYDIPVTATIPNPSDALRRVAVRTSKSDWTVLTDQIPWTIINELREAGSIVNLRKFDASEGPALLAAVEQALQSQIYEAGASAEASAENAAEQYANSDKPTAKKYYEQRIKTAAKQAREKLDAFDNAAKVFGFDARRLGLQAAAGVSQAMQTNIYVRAEKYVQAAALLRAQNTATGNALAAAAEQNAVPADILADAIEDEGGDASGLRAAFAETPAGEPETFTLGGDDN